MSPLQAPSEEEAAMEEERGNCEEGGGLRTFGQLRRESVWKKRRRPVCTAYPLTECRNAPRTYMKSATDRAVHPDQTPSDGKHDSSDITFVFT